MKWMRLIGVLAVLSAGFLAFRDTLWERIGGPADIGAYDFDAAARRTSDNDALACTDGTCTRPDILVAPSAEQPESALSRLAARLEHIEPRHRRVDDGSDPTYARYVVRSRIMRYPDTVDIQAVRLGDGRTGLRAYSRSLIGRSDLGVNARRLERLFADQPDF